MLDARDLAWPVLSLDFEASALGRGSYPIEVALCSWPSPDVPAVAWSTLILPHPEWVEDGVWEFRSQLVHGITTGDLVGAPSPADVVAALDRLAPLGSTAWCDGGDHDAYWLDRLATTAGRRPRVALGSLHRLHEAMGPAQQDRMHAFGASRVAVHRAAADALDHLSSIAAALGLPDPTADARAATRP